MTGENQSWWESMADALDGTATVGPDAGESAADFFGSLAGDLAAPAVSAARAADFLSDPPGWLLTQLETFTSWLAGSVMPSLVEATKPDLSAEWFLSAYAVTFGLAFFVMAILSILNLVRLASGAVASADVVDALTYQAVWFFLGTLIGPPVGYMIAQVVGAASDALLGWAVQDNVEGVVGRLREFSDTGAFLPEAGGWLLAVVILLFLITGLVMVVVAHLIALVTLYFVGVLFPLTQVWRMDPKRRGLADSAVLVWLCILASHALIFLLLGVAFHWVGNAGFAFLEDPEMNSVAQAIAAGFAMILAGVSPLMLFKLAKVLPSTAGQAGPSIPSGLGSSPGGGTPSLRDHAQQQASKSESAPSGTGQEGSSDSAPSSSPDGSDGGGAGEKPGALEQRANDHRSGLSGAGVTGSGTGTGSGEGVSTSAGTGTGTGSGEGVSTSAGSDTATKAGAGGGSAAGGAATGEAAGAAEGAATGGRFGPAGALVGAGLGIAAQGVKKAWDTSVETSKKAGETAAEDMGRREID